MKKINFFLITILLGVFVFLTGMLVFSYSKINSIELKTDSKIKAQASYKQVKLKIIDYLERYKGQYLWKVNLKDITKKMESIYLRGEFQVQRKWPHRLVVFLKEETTFLLLLKQNQRFYSVSQEGHIGAEKNRTDSLNFPILREKTLEKSLQLRQRAVTILFELPKTGSFFSMENISEIFYKKSNDSLWFYLVSDYFIVELKKSPSLKKINNIDFVLNYLRKQGRTKALIDARLDKKIIVKKLN